MRQQQLLQNKAGCTTHDVLSDTQVTLALVSVLKRQYVWEDCLNCLNLVLNVRPELLGKEYTDKRFTRVGNASLKDVDPSLFRALIDAVLSPHFVALPDRRLAGLTALQMLYDAGISLLDAELGPTFIRALGFASDKKVLDKALAALSRHARSPDMQYEMSLAYARCMQPAAALDELAKVTGLTKERRIEARLAVSLSFADCADMDGAYEHLESLRDDEDLWTGEQTAYERNVTVRMAELRILYASMMSVLPRLPFTENFHSFASRGHSRTFAAQYVERISRLLTQTIAHLRKDLDRDRWSLLGIDRLVFNCECLAFVMSSATTQAAFDVSVSTLSMRLHSLQRGMARRLAESESSGHVAEPAMSSLRHFLWAIALTTRLPQSRRLEIILVELDHAMKRVPGFVPSVAELEPALVTALPPNIWAMSLKGSFKAQAAFMISDEFMNDPGLISAHPHTAQLIDMARVAWRKGCSDNRLFPLCIWIAASQGNYKVVKHLLEESCEVAQVRVLPGSLALVNVRDRTFYEQMFGALSLSKPSAGLAINRLYATMRRQHMSVKLGPRIATTLLYCCVSDDNFPVAKETVAILESLPNYDIPSKTHELLMRVCIVSGNIDGALPIFQHLNYVTRQTLINEPSFVRLMAHTVKTPLSPVSADHVFDTWVRIMDYQGRISAALLEAWSLLGPGREACSKKNRLLPASGVSIEQALENVGVSRAESRSMSDQHFLRDWEFIMVMELVAAYVSAGLVDRVDAWEKLIVEALYEKKIHLGATLIASMARVQRQHLKHGDWEGIRACLSLVVAIDKNSEVGLFRKDSHYMNQAPVLRAISVIMRRDTGSLSAQIKRYLEELDAAYPLCTFRQCLAVFLKDLVFELNVLAKLVDFSHNGLWTVVDVWELVYLGF
ncbi:hypothetical protein GGH13_003882 [Coemansia sp. S155-1]|nr:hypothetical protein GGH13_003882 [Coemansia sp. S155-1]